LGLGTVIGPFHVLPGWRGAGLPEAAPLAGKKSKRRLFCELSIQVQIPDFSINIGGSDDYRFCNS
jgi:hypothetical protein